MKSLLLKGTVVFMIVVSMLGGEAVVAQAAVAQQTAAQSEYGIWQPYYDYYHQALTQFQQAIDSNNNIPPQVKSAYDTYFVGAQSYVSQLFTYLAGLFG